MAKPKKKTPTDERNPTKRNSSKPQQHSSNRGGDCIQAGPKHEMTIAELQLQKRWVLWRSRIGQGKETKVPYQPNGKRAMSNNPATWSTYAECKAAVSQFSGVGLTLGNGVFGVDIDKCCDAVTGKLTPESREIVIALDSYGEYSPSGTGCHVFGLGDLPGDEKPVVRPIPGAKQIEIKGHGFYFTFTARHLHKTPLDLMPRQEQLTALCNRVLGMAQAKTSGMVVTAADGARKNSAS